MKSLKSMKDFEAGTKALSSEELKNVTGGMNKYYWIVTTKTAGDRVQMCQQYVYDGSHYVPYGIPYATGQQTTYLG